jgi:hypothetical protein
MNNWDGTMILLDGLFTAAFSFFGHGRLHGMGVIYVSHSQFV